MSLPQFVKRLIQFNAAKAASGTDVIYADQGNGEVAMTAAQLVTFCISIFTVALASGAGAIARTLLSKLFDIVLVSDFGMVGDGTDESARFQAALDSMSSGRLFLVGGKTYTINLAIIQNKTNFTLMGHGATLNIQGAAADGNYAGLRGAGSLSNVKVLGITIVGDGSTTNKHAGWWTPSGTVMTDIEIAHWNIQNTVLGVSSNTKSGGSQRNVHVHHISCKNIVGTVSGQGYAIHVADGSGQPIGFHAHDIVTDGVQRHSVYLAYGSGMRVHDVDDFNHRSTVAGGTILPSVNIARVSQVDVSNIRGWNVFDGFINVIKASIVADEIRIRDCRVYSMGNAVPSYTVGPADPTAADPDTGNPVGAPGRVYLTNCHAEYDSINVEPFRIYAAAQVVLEGCTWNVTNVTAANAGIDLYASGETSGTATYSQSWKFRNNRGTMTSSNGSNTRVFRLETTFSQSAVAADFSQNDGVYSDVLIFPATSVSNPNLRAFNQSIQGLTFVSGVGLLNAVSGPSLYGDKVGLGTSSPLTPIHSYGVNNGAVISAARLENFSATAVSGAALDFNGINVANFVGGRISVYQPDGTQRHRMSWYLNNSTTSQSLAEMLRVVPGAGFAFAGGNVSASPVSVLEAQGSFGCAIQTINTAGTTTLDNTYHTIVVDATAGNITLNLPASSAAVRREYVFKRKDATANVVTIKASGSELIDNANTQTPIASQYAKAKIQCDGTQWWIM